MFHVDSWIVAQVFAFQCESGVTRVMPAANILSSWIYSKAVRKSSKTYETARFLLDHPRRCFIYMFPSRQTWLLLTILVGIK